MQLYTKLVVRKRREARSKLRGDHFEEMQAEPSQVQSKILRKAKTSEEYELYKAALEWNVAEPIVIGSRDDLRSEQHWKGLVEPYHHQVTNLMTFCRRLPVTLLADDVGLGKTISAGLIASELIARSRLSKLLVVCPKLLGPQWQEELDAKFGLKSKVVTGGDLIHAEPEEPGAIITTYQSARMYLEKIPVDRFQMLVLDEAHKLRNLYGTDQPPQVALCFRDAFQERRFRFVLMLTATPIHNRLWDLYSLVELLTVARGHENPFGSEGLFARRFIADGRDKARQIKPEAREEFRSIVYGYMSRVRRQDANLYFPEREVLLRRVVPTGAELELIEVLKEHIEHLNILAQISILQALTSSPHALMAQLNNMAKNETVPQELAFEVRRIVTGMGTSAKLVGLGLLIDTLSQEDPLRWRLVVFTGRIETQTTIQLFLEERGLNVGVINGSTGPRNQETLERFRDNTPDLHVIVSTEAGSEGVNLQVANVLVNFDLPWNPMIVEQRIGRIQRLASDHAKVAIFNIILGGTFEEYIVGRLMEKLQLAAHAIGDIESLLEASGVGDDEGGAKGFEEQVRKLVLAALTGKDYELAMRQAESSIEAAKSELEREEENINQLLGGMDGAEYAGPQAPNLTAPNRSMELGEFATSALRHLGAELEPRGDGLYMCRDEGKSRLIQIGRTPQPHKDAMLYSPDSPAFLTLVDKIVRTGIHRVRDRDLSGRNSAETLAFDWVKSFGGQNANATPSSTCICFEGSAIVRARLTVAHDSYERLVEVSCSPGVHQHESKNLSLSLPKLIEDAESVGIKTSALMEAVMQNPDVAEFRRFYLERREMETEAASADAQKRQKLEDDFTPRVEARIVALDGDVFRRIVLRVDYDLGQGSKYESELTVSPHDHTITDSPALELCALSSRMVPADCLSECEVSGTTTMRHLLSRSEISGRYGLPGNTLVCSLSGKRVLADEAERSAVSGSFVSSDLLLTSEISNLRAEPEHCGKCAFTQAVGLNSELATSEVSGKTYRADQKETSVVSGQSGHTTEFVKCNETRQPILSTEAEQCEVTGVLVRPGILEECTNTHKRALPSELGRCLASGKRVLRSRLVTSSISERQVLDELAVASLHGEFCCPDEAIQCTWTGRVSHPMDVVTCELTGVPIHVSCATGSKPFRLEPLVTLLEGNDPYSDMVHSWEKIEHQVSGLMKSGKCKVEAALLSPDQWCLAVSCSVKSYLGMRTRYLGILFEMEAVRTVGKYALGKRTKNGWIEVR